ncbi:MAG: transketolase, partial [Acidimicrobiales bacterium]|nr:transketolase [Acidimicrobiales bacterium]
AKVMYVWSHDSVGVGEDGPTHQPIEQVAALRAIPNLDVYRPADGTEVAGAWAAAVDGDGPAAMILTRQNVPVLQHTSAEAVAKGAYTVVQSSAPDDPAVVLVATGSEVHLAVDAAARLAADGIDARVVSMPCWERFAAQDARYRNSVLPGDVPTVSVEAGTSFGWAAHAHAHVAIDRFGLSAPGDEAMAECGITVDNVVDTARRLLDEAHNTAVD